MIAKCVPAQRGTRTFATGIAYVQKHEHRRHPELVGVGVSFADRVSYASAEEKAAWTHTRGVSSVATAAYEMEAVARLSVRCADPVQHEIIAYAKHEHPTRDQMVADVENLLGALDMADHQYVMSVHTDTDDLHAHIIANRVGLDGHANAKWQDRPARERLCAQIAAERGWDIVVGFHNRDIVQEHLGLETMPAEPQRRVFDGDFNRVYERGELPWQDAARPYVFEAVERATSWDDLRARLDAHGVVLKAVEREGRFQGLAFAEGLAPDAPGCAASRIDACCKLSALEARFGPYAPPERASQPGLEVRAVITADIAEKPVLWRDQMRAAILTAVDTAQSWDDLRSRLGDAGVVVKAVERGGRFQGLAFAGEEGENAPGCGASRIDDRCKRSALEARFGPFPDAMRPDAATDRGEDRTDTLTAEAVRHVAITQEESRMREDTAFKVFEPNRTAADDRGDVGSGESRDVGTNVQTSNMPMPIQAVAFGGYGAYLVDHDDRRRAERGAELQQNPRLVLDDLFERGATITTSELRRAIIGDVADAEQAEHVWSALENLVIEGKLLGVVDPAAHMVDGDGAAPKKRDDGPRWTTPEMLALERELEHVIRDVTACERRAAVHVDAVRLDALTLHAGQRAAVERVLRGDMLVVIEGHAGSGKSYAFGEMRNLLETHEFIGLAQGGQAAWELEKSSGIRSRTIASFVRAMREGRCALEKPTAIVLDEANLVGTREMLDVMRIARDHHMPVFIAGDGSQLPGVAAGGAFRMLTGIAETTTIGEVVRLHGWRRDAADSARSGTTIEQAIAMYAEHGFFHEALTSDDAVEKIVDLWFARTEAVEGRLLIAFRNEDVAALNSEARMRLREQGAVGDGVRVVTRKHGELEFAVGDRITFTKNDDELRVRNGTLGTVLAVEGSALRVRLDGSQAREVLVDTERYDDLGYGYAVTAYKAEGMTVAYSAWLATRADMQSSAYVALSRSKGDCDIVISQEEFTFARKDGGEEAQDFQRNLSFLLARERVKDLATEYPLRGGSKPLRTADDTAKDAAEHYTMRPNDQSGVEQIRRRVGQDRFDQWFVAAPGRDLRTVFMSDDPGVRSWGMVHAVLEANRVCIRRRNGGLVFADAVQPDRWKCKASALPRAFHLGELERVLGVYREPEDAERAAYRARAEALRNDRQVVTSEREEARESVRERVERDSARPSERAFAQAQGIADNARLRAAYQQFCDRFYQERREGWDVRRQALWNAENVQRRLESERRWKSKQMQHSAVRLVTPRGGARRFGYGVVEKLHTLRTNHERSRARARWEGVKAELTYRVDQERADKPARYREFVAERAESGDRGAQRVLSYLDRRGAFTVAPEKTVERSEQSSRLAVELTETEQALAERSAEIEREKRSINVRLEPEPLEQQIANALKAVLAAAREQALEWTLEEMQRLEDIERKRGHWNPVVRVVAGNEERSLLAERESRVHRMLDDADWAFRQREISKLTSAYDAACRDRREGKVQLVRLEEEQRAIGRDLRAVEGMRRELETMEGRSGKVPSLDRERVPEDPRKRFATLRSTFEAERKRFSGRSREEKERENDLGLEP